MLLAVACCRLLLLASIAYLLEPTRAVRHPMRLLYNDNRSRGRASLTTIQWLTIEDSFRPLYQATASSAEWQFITAPSYHDLDLSITFETKSRLQELKSQMDQISQALNSRHLHGIAISIEEIYDERSSRCDIQSRILFRCKSRASFGPYNHIQNLAYTVSIQSQGSLATEQDSRSKSKNLPIPSHIISPGVRSFQSRSVSLVFVSFSYVQKKLRKHLAFTAQHRQVSPREA